MAFPYLPGTFTLLSSYDGQKVGDSYEGLLLRLVSVKIDHASFYCQRIDDLGRTVGANVAGPCSFNA